MLGRVLLGKYRVSRLLDRGGMCEIWLARPLGDAREVVVKVLQKQFLAQPKSRESLRREIHVLARFQHASAVGFLDSAPNDPGGPILVMEYLRGLDLGALLHRERRLTPERTGRLLARLCDVLGAAHQAGIVHRDIKPGNLMILDPCTPQENVKLMDFGLATMSSLLYIGANDLGDHSAPTASGTPEYIAPEQALGHESDARSDLYSVGVLLYEMLTGRRPFEHGRAEDLLRAHAYETPPAFAERGVTHVSAAVEAAVQACLEKHPEQRPRDAGELIQRYETALGKRLSTPLPGSSALLKLRVEQSAATGSSSTTLPSTEGPMVRQDFEANVPQAMAMLKLKGFLHDLGSDVISSEPGSIRVRLADPESPKKKSGLIALLDRARKSGAVKLVSATEVELRMERYDPSQPNRLRITLIMRPSTGNVTPEWRGRCQKIGMDLKAYLMGC